MREGDAGTAAPDGGSGEDGNNDYDNDGDDEETLLRQYFSSVVEGSPLRSSIKRLEVRLHDPLLLSSG